MQEELTEDQTWVHCMSMRQLFKKVEENRRHREQMLEEIKAMIEARKMHKEKCKAIVMCTHKKIKVEQCPLHMLNGEILCMIMKIARQVRPSVAQHQDIKRKVGGEDDVA